MTTIIPCQHWETAPLGSRFTREEVAKFWGPIIETGGGLRDFTGRDWRPAHGCCTPVAAPEPEFTPALQAALDRIEARLAALEARS